MHEYVLLYNACNNKDNNNNNKDNIIISITMHVLFEVYICWPIELFKG